MDMNSVQGKAYTRALAFLNAAGVQYKIMEGDTVLASTIPDPVVEKVKRVHVNDWVTLTDYRNILRELPASGTVVWQRSDRPEFAGRGWSSFAACVNHAAKEIIGEDKYIIANADGRCELLRVE